MQSSIREFTEKGQKYYLVQPIGFLDLTFKGNKLVRAFNRKLNKEYKGAGLSVFTEEYDLFNRYYIQAVMDLSEYKSDARRKIAREIEEKRAKKKVIPAAEPTSYVCIMHGKVVARSPTMLGARKAAIKHAGYGNTVYIWRGDEFVGDVSILRGTAVFRTRGYKSVRALREDGALL